MNYLFVCPICGRLHTMDELKESRFCRDCGKFLNRRNKVDSSSIKEKMEWQLFPYVPYPQQIDFMRDVKNIVCNRGILVAEACNGFGKTICALVSILFTGRRIVYATRTHEQVRQVLFEIEMVNKSSNTRFRAVNLASRQHLCLNEACRKLSAIEGLEACRVLRELGECKYRIEFESLPPLPLVLSTSKLLKEGKMRGFCPYFLARKVAENCSVIVAPYQYVFNEHVRARINLVLSEKILVFDEAHNADQIGREVLSDVLSDRGLNRAKNELEAVKASTEFLDQLVVLLKKKISEKVVIESGVELHRFLKDALEVEQISSFVDALSDIVDEIRKYKVDRGENPMCYLNGVLSFLSLVENSPRDSYVAVYSRSSFDSNFVEYRCLDPALGIKPVLDKAYGVLVMSGTLSPIQSFAKILGLDSAEIRSYSAIVDPDNVRALIDPYVTTRFSERSITMINRIGERLSRLAARIPNGVLVFFPQRTFMLNTLKNWKAIGLIKSEKNHLLLGSKFIFVEGAQAVENKQVIEGYKTAAKINGGAMLCGVFRGRNAEGSNFPYEEASGIFLVGVPYADYSDPLIKTQINYYNRKERGLGQMWYLMDAFRAANQALGRGIRHRDDWCNFILMDYRYQKHQALISEWVLVNGVQILPSTY